MSTIVFVFVVSHTLYAEASVEKIIQSKDFKVEVIVDQKSQTLGSLYLKVSKVDHVTQVVSGTQLIPVGISQYRPMSPDLILENEIFSLKFTTKDGNRAIRYYRRVEDKLSLLGLEVSGVYVTARLNVGHELKMEIFPKEKKIQIEPVEITDSEIDSGQEIRVVLASEGDLIIVTYFDVSENSFVTRRITKRRDGQYGLEKSLP